MTLRRFLRPPTAGLTLALAFAIVPISASPLLAQPMSSGSGAGTGTGMSGGAARNSTGTGLESGGANATGTGLESGSGLLLPGASNYFGPSDSRGRLISPSRRPAGGSVPLGPGINTDFPGETSLIPFGATIDAGLIGGVASFSTVTDKHLKYAQAITAPGERSLTLSRIARAATFSNQLDMAEKALEYAGAAAMLIDTGLVRDQRLISIITARMNLAEAWLREGRSDTPIPAPLAPSPDADAAKPDADPIALPNASKPAKSDRNALIRRAQVDWQKASEMSTTIGNPTYRSEMMYRVADSIAYGSQSIVNEFPNAPDNSGDKHSTGLNTSFEGLPDRLLQDAANLCARIDRPVWHDRGLVVVASAAAESRQFARALATARMIPQPEVRTDALLKIAEIQARRNDPDGATATYREAALAVSSIPLDDPRAVLAGVLIDNLISVGRFEDARASVRLYPDQARRVVALGAIAESQGRRGAAASAMAWINNDIPPQYRSQLYRRVSNGVVSAIEQNRNRELSNRSER